MKIGELFVNLGLKGEDQVGKGLTGVKGGLGEVKSMSLEAKAAILSIFYGFGKLIDQSDRLGASIVNFSASTGLSGVELQKWQYAAQQASVSADSVMSSIKGVQNSLTEMQLTGKAPAGFSMIAQTLGDFDIDKAGKDAMYTMTKLNEFAQHTEIPTAIRANMLKSFGVGEDVFAAMVRGKFNPNELSKAPTYSDSEAAALERRGVAWKNLGTTIERAIGKFNLLHGGELVSDLTKITGQALKLADAFMKFADAVHVFEWIGKIFDGWVMILKLVTEAVNNVTKDKGGVLKGLTKEGSSISTGLMEVINGAVITGVQAVVPSLKPAEPSKSTQNVHINQTNNFHDTKGDHRKIGESVHQAVKHAVRSLNQAASQ